MTHAGIKKTQPAFANRGVKLATNARAAGACQLVKLWSQARLASRDQSTHGAR